MVQIGVGPNVDVTDEPGRELGQVSIVGGLEGLATEQTLDGVLTALGLTATEATLAQVLAALGELGTEATLQQLAAALGLTATEATLDATRVALVDLKSTLESSANAVYTATHVPTLPFVAGATFPDPAGSIPWIDARHIGSILFLLASLRQTGPDDPPAREFASVTLEWSDDGVVANGSVTTLDNEPFAAGGGLVYNVHFDILDLMSGSFFRPIVDNGADDQDASMVGLLAVTKHPWKARVGIREAVNLLLKPDLVRNIATVETPDGALQNWRGTAARTALVNEAGATITPSGARHSEGFLDYQSHDFGVGNPGEVDKLVDLGTTGGATKTQDPIGAGLIIETNGGRGFWGSQFQFDYTNNAGHGGMGEITIGLHPDSDPISGDAKIEWGLISDDLLSRIAFGYDAGGFYTRLYKGTEQLDPGNPDLDVVDLQDDWIDPCKGAQFSQFVRRVGGLLVPEPLSIGFGNLYRIAGEFLYFAEQAYILKAPIGELFAAHIHQYPNRHVVPSVVDANLRLFLDVDSGTSGANLKTVTGSMHGGIYSSKVGITGRDRTGKVQEAEFTERGSFIVAQGERISQVRGRTHHEVDGLSVAASGQLEPIPAGKVFQCLKVKWSVENGDATGAAHVRLYDGEPGAGGVYKDSIRIEEATSGLGGISTIANDGQDYVEPLQFDTDVWIDIVQGGPVSIDLKLVGYLEDEA